MIVFTGPSGKGKTQMMSDVFKNAGRNENWVVLDQSSSMPPDSIKVQETLKKTF